MLLNLAPEPVILRWRHSATRSHIILWRRPKDLASKAGRMKTAKARFAVAAVAASALLAAARTHGAQLASGGTTIDRDAVVP